MDARQFEVNYDPEEEEAAAAVDRRKNLYLSMGLDEHHFHPTLPKNPVFISIVCIHLTHDNEWEIAQQTTITTTP